MRADLQRLKRDTESGRRVSAAPVEGTAATEPVDATAGAAGAAMAPALPSSQRSQSTVMAAARQHKWEIGITSLVLVLLIAAAGYGIYAFLLRARHVAFQNFSVHKMTDNDKAILVAVSPDGKYTVGVVEVNGRQTVFLCNVPPPVRWQYRSPESSMQVVPPGRFQYFDVRFSPDGS
jgi:F0F1-type ATP synthase membrane subunit c/vacuolar-type H+-ATPase subunit K